MRKQGGNGSRAAVFDAPRQHTLRSARLGSPEARVFRVLTSSTVRKGSLSRMDLARLGPALLSTISKRVRAGEPVQLTLMAFPFKVPNPAKTGDRVLPDQAELAAIERLALVADLVRAVYSPGLVVEVIHDGAFIADVFGVSLPEVRAYEAYFSKLLQQHGAEGCIRCHDFESLQRGAGLEPGIANVEHDATRWWYETRSSDAWNDCFRKTLGMLNLRDLSGEEAGRLLEHARGGALPGEFAEVEARIHGAMIGYRVKDALIHARDPRPLLFPDAIHATTRVQPGRLALWLVRRGDGLLPWHGVGATDEQGRVRVIHALDARARGYRPHFVAGEPTPFCYRDPAGSCS